MLSTLAARKLVLCVHTRRRNLSSLCVSGGGGRRRFLYLTPPAAAFWHAAFPLMLMTAACMTHFFPLRYPTLCSHAVPEGCSVHCAENLSCPQSVGNNSRLCAALNFDNVARITTFLKIIISTPASARRAPASSGLNLTNANFW